MLRSIVAIWSLAFTLIFVAVFAGCGGDDSCGVPPTAPADHHSDPSYIPTCPGSCGVCGAGEFCFTPGSVITAGVPPFCARSRKDSRDCRTGGKCTDLLAAMQPAVCVSDKLPALCGSPTEAGWHCDFAPPSCKEADTLAVGYSQPANRTCGYELVHCDRGCDDSTTAAHCK